MRELYRKLFHITFGAIIAGGIYVLGRDDGLAALFVMLAAGLVLIQWKLSGFEEKIIDFFLSRMERKVTIPGIGALMFLLGAILALSLSKTASFAVVVLLVFAFGDGASTLVGLKGSHRIPYNRKKTWEGSLAFFLTASAVSVFFLGPAALVLCAILAFVESLPIPFDDNFTITLAGAALSYVL
jgi:dolichol kinase